MGRQKAEHWFRHLTLSSQHLVPYPPAPDFPTLHSCLSLLQIKTPIPSCYSVSHHLHSHIYTLLILILHTLLTPFSCNGASTRSRSLNHFISTTWPQFSCLRLYLPFPSQQQTYLLPTHSHALSPPSDAKPSSRRSSSSW